MAEFIFSPAFLLVIGMGILIVGILGGNFTVEKVRIPKFSVGARIFLALFGTLLIGFTIWSEVSRSTLLQGIARTTAPMIAAAIVFGWFVYQGRLASEQWIDSREKIAQAESRVEAQPEKARPAWDLARVTLDAYFNRNLSQITYIFWFSVFVMVVGFIVIAWGVSQAIQSPSTVAPASITVLAGVITEFIGATFVFIYRSTLQQALNYAKTLERINSVGMAMQILDTIPDNSKPDDLKSKTKANLVELLVKQAHDRPISDLENEK